MRHIEGGLYQGNVRDRTNLEALEEAGITAVVNVASADMARFGLDTIDEKADGIAYYDYGLMDYDLTMVGKETLDEWKAAVGKVTELLSSGERVLVHCISGSNRSSLVCACALHLWRGIPFDEAVEMLTDKIPESRYMCEKSLEVLRRLIG